MARPREPLRWYKVRPGFAIAVCMALAVIAAGFRYFVPPMGQGPAGPSVPAAVFEKPWSDQRFVLVGMGDSVVTGFGAPKGFGFFDLLTSNPKDDQPDMMGRNLRRVFPRLEVLNLALNSSSSGDHLRTQLLRLPQQPGNVKGIVVLSTGGIDLIHDYGSRPPRDEAIYGATWDQALPFIANFRQRLDQLLDGIDAHFPGGCEIFIATIFDPTDGVGDIQKANPILRLFKPLPAWPDGLRIHAAFNDHIRAVGRDRRNVHAVDVHRALMGHGLHCRDKNHPSYHADDPTYWYYFNLEDPNTRGYDAIRRAFLLEMIAVFGPRP